ncbi:hypothetical protein I3260_01250 [Photobacterium damselae]|uniref:hypothetical protein n=1 Tax=Photobacterium damselae TaxID=38293 RepID=UPI001EDDB5C4|nr:hypothetical protein [Photobacterium damselae]MCG3810855.1 hypothetical protein [Photobacterium damselae]
MATGYLTFLIPALLGAQLVFSLVLTKGEICPGQRGRVHKTLPVLLLGWIIATIAQPFAVLPFFALAFFTVKVKTGKTRDAGPIKALYGADVLAAFCWLLLIPSMTLAQTGLSLVSIVLFGALVGHLLLTQARTRLQAFHKILPFAGFVSGILAVLCLCAHMMTLSEQQVSQLTGSFIAALVLLVASLLVWVGHILLHKTVNKWQLLVALGLLILSGAIQLNLFY